MGILGINVMSGTGKSLQTARWLCDLAAAAGWTVRLRPVTAVQSFSEDETHAAMIFPTHGFTMPWPVLRAALRAPAGRGRPVLIVAARAGTKLGPLFFPGLDGSATLIPAAVLALKGYRVRGTLGLDLPSNWMAIHPGFNAAATEAIFARAKKRSERYFHRFLQGSFFVANPFSLLAGLALLPLSLGYLLVGRILLGKLFYASAKCNGCGICVATCPFSALRMSAGGHPWWTWHCESCMHCMAFCPRRAIDVNYPLAVTWGFVRAAAGGALLTTWSGGLLGSLASMALAIACILVLYPVFWALARLRGVGVALHQLTPTRFFRRYRAPGVAAGDMVQLETSGGK